jgi:hypothetical protein
MVDPIGLEPTTSAMSRQRSNQLSYGSGNTILRKMIVYGNLNSLTLLSENPSLLT